VKKSRVSGQLLPRALVLLTGIIAGFWAFDVTRRVRAVEAELRAWTERVPVGRALAALADTGTTAATGVLVGSASAPVTMIEFNDYECPFCRRFFQETLPTLKADYIDKGKVRLLVRDLPLRQIHPNAARYAAAARCAALVSPGSYDRFQAALFENSGRAPDSVIADAAANASVPLSAIEACMAEGDVNEEIAADERAASELGLTGTPAFVIGRSSGDSVVSGRIIRGALPLASFRAVIDSLLADDR